MRRTIEPVLRAWKNQSNRLPIILRGARQVGKSFIIEKFGKENFETLITCNFEFRPELINCFDHYDPLSICAKLEVAFKTKIIPGQTLLFLDEIQNCPQAITALRYFKEKLPALHVIAAGSLLEFVLHEERFSFPVGRVQFLYLKPLSFYEYLLSQNHDRLVDMLDQVTLNKPFEPFIHEQLLMHLREYFLIGGMPSVVRCFLETKSFLECQIMLTSLLETYRSDFPKYTTKTQYKYLQTFFEKAPALVSNHFKYSHISPEHRSKDLKIALDQLIWAGLLYRVLATSGSVVPLQAHVNESKFKLLFLDCGLINCANQLRDCLRIHNGLDSNSFPLGACKNKGAILTKYDPLIFSPYGASSQGENNFEYRPLAIRRQSPNIQTAWNTELIQINAGSQAEQFVGQELLAYANPHLNSQLYYWARDKKGAMAEVDYVIQAGAQILPVEVKSGTTGSLKSLAQFLIEKKAPFGIRISQHPLSFHDKVLSIPFYLISQLPRLLNQVSS